jgi:Rrf2 family cysteine metabolism transcriptional repressor
MFSARVGYACAALLELALRYDNRQPVRVQAISDAHFIPKRFLVQILLQLKGAGLVESTRGSSGGYTLALDPKSITLRDIIRLIDQPADNQPRKAREGAANARKTATGPAPEPSTLVRAINSVWDEVHKAQQKILSETTLADLVARSQAEAELMYQI